ncbi:substrate-binding domain-containing protein [Methylobacillus sp.]|uniref:substrate-binding domain-containing protein n=1 Tax=Methylobacillus sp. TaxID=56818 RepID=UPI002FE0391C
MLKTLKKVSLVLSLVSISQLAMAGAATNTLEVDSEVGRGGLPVRQDNPDELKVCADYDNLPYSNGKQEGFENKIAELLAKDLGKTLSYQFWYDRMGFIRNTLNARRCDVIIGTVTGNDMVMTSKPYYRSGYVFVYRKDSGYDIKDWDSPDLRKGIIGVVGQTPPSRPLDDKGLLGNSRPYRIQRDLNLPPSFVIDDLIKGDIDVAILWGPIAGYYAKKASIPLVVVPAPEYEQENIHGKEYWNISLAVRKRDKERLAMLQGALDRQHDNIIKILDEYGIPHVPVIEGDDIEKKSKNRGDAVPKFE